MRFFTDQHISVLYVHSKLIYSGSFQVSSEAQHLKTQVQTFFFPSWMEHQIFIPICESFHKKKKVSDFSQTSFVCFRNHSKH